MKPFKILHVLNNNSLLIGNGEEEMIIVGKGIGFKRNRYDVLPRDTFIEKQYHLIKNDNYAQKSGNPRSIINHTASIVSLITALVEKEIKDKSLISLSNHIAAMLIRIENQENFINPFQNETKAMYAESFKKAENLSQKVKETLEIELPEAEIGFLTLYIHSIENDSQTQSVEQVNAVVYQINDILENKYPFCFDKESLLYTRFVVHIKFVVQRLLKNEELVHMGIMDTVFEKYEDFLPVAKDIEAVIEEALGSPLSKDELAYIILHIVRLASLDIIK